MNLGIEYVLRTGIQKKLVSFPCSVFMESAIDRLASVIYSKEDRYLVRYWHLSVCDPNAALPPMTEVTVDRLSDALPQGYIALDCDDPFFPGFRNSWRTPMPHDEYQYYCNEFYQLVMYSHDRPRWLWETFREVCPFDINHYCDDWVVEMLATQEYHKSQWKRWSLWHRFIYDFCPGEMLFTACEGLE